MPRTTGPTRIFDAKLRAVLASCIALDLSDNFDHYRYGPDEARARKPPGPGHALMSRLIHRPKVFRGLLRMPWLDRLTLGKRMSRQMDRLERMHALLDDRESRELLVAIIAYRILGHRKVRLPLSTPELRRGVEALAATAHEGEKLEVSGSGIRLPGLDISSLGYPIHVHAPPDSAHRTFAIEQYRWRDSIGADPGDVVLDLGGGYGDTALYFAHRVGPSGRVCSFEFIPANLKVLRRNLELNPDLASRIDVVERPVWSEAGRELQFIDSGRSSRIVRSSRGDGAATATTTTVDEIVETMGLSRVDLIKMDIEGAETEALRGAARTLRTHRPKLAISIYHSLDDLAGLAPIIADLGEGYRFHLKHATIHAEETILFARVEPE